MKLVDRFVDMVTRLDAPSNNARGIGLGWFNVLASLYTEPHRRYHGLNHIENLLGRLDALTPFSRPGFDRFLEAEVAIWFHDAVYEIGSHRNEETSALLARAFLFSVGAVDDSPTNGNRVGAFLDAVNEAIIATKHTGAQVNGNAARIMCDLDMAGFADTWELFEENNVRIREEYAAVPDEKYRWGRAAFLANLLNRKIYYVLDELEEPARKNIERHIRELVTESPDGGR